MKRAFNNLSFQHSDTIEIFLLEHPTFYYSILLNFIIKIIEKIYLCI